MADKNDNWQSSTGVADMAGEIGSTIEKLRELQMEVEAVGGPAAQDLRNRLENLVVEEEALLRNASESNVGPHRRTQIEALLKHIEEEQGSLAEDAKFLKQAAPSSASLAAETGQRIYSVVVDGMRKILSDLQPLGRSVFVNHTHGDLVEHHDLKPDEEK